MKNKIKIIILFLTLFVIRCGSEFETLLDNKDADTQIPRNDIYWSEVSGTINCIKFDGSEKKTILTSAYAPLDIDLDTSGERIFWTEYTGTGYRIRRCGIDGSVSAVVYSSDDGPTAIAIDSSTGTIFWNEFHTNHDIWGSGVSFDFSLKSKLFNNLAHDYTYSICVDSVIGKAYFSVNSYYNNTGIVFGSGKSGSLYTGDIVARTGQQKISYEGPVVPSSPFKGIAVDHAGGHVYYATSTDNGVRPKTIVRSDLLLQDNADLIYAGVADIQKIALDLTNRKIYWTSESDNSIYRADLDSPNSNIEKFLQLDSKPTGIAIFH